MTLLDTGNGDNNVILNAKVATVKAGNGNDKLTVSGDSISIANAKINLGAGDDTLFVRAANIAGATINLGAGNDIIDIASIKNPNFLKGTTIDGGVGRDTMLVIGDTSPFGPKEVGLTLKNIEVIQVKGRDNLSSGGVDKSSKLLVSAVNGEKLTLTKYSSGNGTLEIIATNKDTNIDLSRLNNITEGDEIPLTALTLSKVGAGATTGVTVKLNKDDGIAETIKLAANAANVTINGFNQTNDVLNLKATFNKSFSADETKLYTSSDKATLTLDKLVYTSVDLQIGADNKVTTALTGIYSATSAFTASSTQKAYVAQVVAGSNKTLVYEITNSDGQSDLSTNDTVKLIATINAELNPVANNGVIA